jgi:hypothetical protein
LKHAISLFLYRNRRTWGFKVRGIRGVPCDIPLVTISAWNPNEHHHKGAGTQWKMFVSGAIEDVFGHPLALLHSICRTLPLIEARSSQK